MSIMTAVEIELRKEAVANAIREKMDQRSFRRQVKEEALAMKKLNEKK